ncbi:MAG: hypothetical protein GDA50_06640 [Alphaproteobacteria bacterium GM202ARS2]|nr:hypothetical protein [Alphaproteobacteria bacterium GM202ARS2]
MMMHGHNFLRCVGLFVGVIVVSFVMAERHRALDDKERRVQAGMVQAERDIRTLRATWSALNGSARLATLNERYVFLSGVAPVVFEHGERAELDEVCRRGTC